MVEPQQIYGEHLKHASGVLREESIKDYFMGDEKAWKELLGILEKEVINQKLEIIHQSILKRKTQELKIFMNQMKTSLQ